MVYSSYRRRESEYADRSAVKLLSIIQPLARCDEVRRIGQLQIDHKYMGQQEDLGPERFRRHEQGSGSYRSSSVRLRPVAFDVSALEQLRRTTATLRLF